MPLKRSPLLQFSRPATHEAIEPRDCAANWSLRVSNDFLFTSESVSEGHPDKVADQISDAILDEMLQGQDPASSRVAVETMVTTGLVHAGRRGDDGRPTSTSRPGRRGRSSSAIGYDNTRAKGFDYEGLLRGIGLLRSSRQSPDIARGVDRASRRAWTPSTLQGAGDQGLMFGYACDDTPGADAGCRSTLRPPARPTAQAQVRHDGRHPLSSAPTARPR